jgi:hypothetical protein
MAALFSAALGLAGSVYGANKASKAQAASLAQQQYEFERRWLLRSTIGVSNKRRMLTVGRWSVSTDVKLVMSDVGSKVSLVITKIDFCRNAGKLLSVRYFRTRRPLVRLSLS